MTTKHHNRGGFIIPFLIVTVMAATIVWAVGKYGTGAPVEPAAASATTIPVPAQTPVTAPIAAPAVTAPPAVPAAHTTAQTPSVRPPRVIPSPARPVVTAPPARRSTIPPAPPTTAPAGLTHLVYQTGRTWPTDGRGLATPQIDSPKFHVNGPFKVVWTISHGPGSYADCDLDIGFSPLGTAFNSAWLGNNGGAVSGSTVSAEGPGDTGFTGFFDCTGTAVGGSVSWSVAVYD